MVRRKKETITAGAEKSWNPNTLTMIFLWIHQYLEQRSWQGVFHTERHILTLLSA